MPLARAADTWRDWLANQFHRANCPCEACLRNDKVKMERASKAIRELNLHGRVSQSIQETRGMDYDDAMTRANIRLGEYYVDIERVLTEIYSRSPVKLRIERELEQKNAVRAFRLAMPPAGEVAKG